MSRRFQRAISLSDLAEMRGWSKLKPEEQSVINQRSRDLAEGLHAEGQSRLANGKNLFAIQEILAPRRMFDRFLRRYFHMSRSTAFVYITLYKTALRDSSKKVLDIAMARNYRAVNRPEIFKTYPPPKTDDPVKIVQYLDGLERKKGKVITIHKDYNGLLKQAIRSIGSCWRHVPEKARRAWMRELLGMELTYFGISHEMSFAPQAIPEAFRRGRGRPALKQAA